MHTTTRAQDLWCPMVRHEGDVGPFNRPARNGNPTNRDVLCADGTAKPIDHQKYGCHCVADKCAMWRFLPTGTTHQEERITPVGNQSKNIIFVDVPDTPTHGFCGLAGNPLI